MNMLPKENFESLIANWGFGQSSVNGGCLELWPLGVRGKEEAVVMVEEYGAKEQKQEDNTRCEKTVERTWTETKRNGKGLKTNITRRAKQHVRFQIC